MRSDAHAGSPTFTAPEGLTNTAIVFQCSVTDGTNTTVDTVTIDVNRDNDAPTAKPAPNQTVDENDVVTLAGPGVDPEGQSLTYTWTQPAARRSCSAMRTQARRPSPLPRASPTPR
ncbi:MAG: hypothetical protein IPJ19_02750 [Planctomycetes bacterium]|nr:hypothetical protein [Planctomycetota bacterium]